VLQWESSFLIDLLHYWSMALRCYTATKGLVRCYQSQGMIQGAVKLGRATNFCLQSAGPCDVSDI